MEGTFPSSQLRQCAVKWLCAQPYLSAEEKDLALAFKSSPPVAGGIPVNNQLWNKAGQAMNQQIRAVLREPWKERVNSTWGAKKAVFWIQDTVSPFLRGTTLSFHSCGAPGNSCGLLPARWLWRIYLLVLMCSLFQTISLWWCHAELEQRLHVAS